MRMVRWGFRSLSKLRARLSRRVGVGFHGSGRLVLLAGMGKHWSAWVREGVKPVQSVGDHVGPGSVLGKAEVARAAGGDELSGGGVQPKPQAEGLPAPGGASKGKQGIQASRSRAICTISSQIWFCAASWRGEVAQAGGAAAVRGPSPLPVAQFEGGDRLSGGVGGEAGQPHAVGVGEAQLGAGVRPFLAHDQPQPLRPAGQAIAAGVEFGDPGAVAGVAVGFHVSRLRPGPSRRPGGWRR